MNPPQTNVTPSQNERYWSSGPLLVIAKIDRIDTYVGQRVEIQEVVREEDRWDEFRLLRISDGFCVAVLDNLLDGNTVGHTVYARGTAERTPQGGKFLLCVTDPREFFIKRGE